MRTFRSKKHDVALASVSTAFCALSALACNAILGIDQGHLVATTDASGTGGNAGTGGSSAGGSAGTGGADAGTGGSTGGTSSGGGSGSGGSGGTGGGADGAAGSGGTGPSGVAGEVHCGTSSCKLPGQTCCVTKATDEAHCSPSCDPTTQLKLACDGSEDCAAGEHCCLPIGGTAASCTTGNCLGRVFCGSNADCAPGQYCAPGSGNFASVFVCTDAPKSKSVWCNGIPCDVSSGKACCYDKSTKAETCSATCGASEVRFDCNSDSDCATGSVCCDSHTGLGLTTGTQCVVGSACPTGRAPVTCGGADSCLPTPDCCLSGLGAACGMTCTGQVLCGTAADCPKGQTCSVVTDTAIGAPTGRTVCTATAL